MAQIDTQQITLSTTAAKILSFKQSRTLAIIVNEDATNVVRIGDSTVVNASGTAALVGLAIGVGKDRVLQSLGPGQSAVAAAELWAVADAGTPKISVLEYGDFS